MADDVRRLRARRGRTHVFFLVVGCLLGFAAFPGPARGAVDFFEPPTSPERVGGTPQALARADLDGDGDVDLAFADTEGGRVHVLINNGAGNFARRSTSPESTRPGEPVDLEAADLDGDGDTDLATVNFNNSTVTVLLNDGTGNFSQPSTSPVPTAPLADLTDMAASDFDGDADVDLVVAGQDLWLLKNDGSGNFSAAGPQRLPGCCKGHIAAADFDDDGDTDIAIARDSPSVRIFVNNGAGAFSQRSTSPEPVRGGENLWQLVVADLDGDGDPDLAVGRHSQPRVSILLNRGSGDFSEPATSPEPVRRPPGTFGGAPNLAAGDFDRDGDIDLAVGRNDLVSILVNRGRADFFEPATSPERIRGFDLQEVVAADLDGDRDVDLATANFASGDASILLNRSRTAGSGCTIRGDGGDNVVRGTSRADVICGGDGEDVIYGLGGNDVVRGGDGNDVLRGGPGNDRLEGGEGDDQLIGGDGDDRLTGDAGRDSHGGQDGSDRINARDGVAGNDVANGGPGGDSCATDPRDTRSSC